MNSELLIKGGLVIDPATKTEARQDLRIQGGVIAEIGENLAEREGAQTIDASGLWVCPGFVDIHTHLRDFGQQEREDVESATMAAAAGGFTTVLAMANTDPPMDNAALLSLLLEKIKKNANIEVLPVACVTKGMAGQELTNMVDLAQMGVEAFSDDGMPVSNLSLLKRGLEYAKLTGKVMISHSEDRDLSHGGAMHEDANATRLGIPGIPGAAESACVASEIEVARETGCRLHFAHISTAASVALIAFAKQQGIPVSADVTPHHLFLTTSDIVSHDTHYKMNPPLRTQADQDALVSSLKDGTIEAIATDHAPHTRLDKAKPFDEAPFGIIGLETAFALCLERLVTPKHLSPLALISLFTVGPSKLLGLPEPSLKQGARANISILDPRATWTYDPQNGYSKSINSPFAGKQMTGKNLITVFKGQIAYQDNERTAKRITTKCAVR